MNVFIPVLLGAGVIASGLAWLVERIARLTSRSGTHHLAEQGPRRRWLRPRAASSAASDPIDLLQRPVTR